MFTRSEELRSARGQFEFWGASALEALHVASVPTVLVDMVEGLLEQAIARCPARHCAGPCKLEFPSAGLVVARCQEGVARA
eukprot:4009901-Alexandrium_andersonii.AAC.1